ncbi:MULTISPECIES: short-chain dehydrogenase [Terrimonas]|uniref:short-chain dehydrogenase n=1 Tax=Terrimonas TaxID=296051 RepID=UPI0023EC57F4|nr:short-chain dehydrogenase [Terrimonas sp. H1YJ31]
MTVELIEKFVANKIKKGESVNIHFKDRHTVTGLFIHAVDYDELKSKNFWRIINNQNLAQWKQTKDMNLARLFNGASFTRLSESESK